MTEVPSLAASLDHFATSLSESTKATMDLGAAVRASERLRTRRSLMFALGTVAIAILIVLNLLLAISSRGTQNTINDCTNPKGECARRGAANTAKVVGNLTQADLTVSFVVNACQLEHPSVSEFNSCIETKLAAVKNGTLKTPQLP